MNYITVMNKIEIHAIEDLFTWMKKVVEKKLFNYFLIVKSR